MSKCVLWLGIEDFLFAIEERSMQGPKDFSLPPQRLGIDPLGAECMNRRLHNALGYITPSDMLAGK